MTDRFESLESMRNGVESQSFECVECGHMSTFEFFDSTRLIQLSRLAAAYAQFQSVDCVDRVPLGA